MKIGILSMRTKLYSTQRLVEAAEKRGHQVEIINTLRCYMNISSSHPTIHYMGKPLKGFDAIIPRIGTSITFYGTALVRQFEMMGVYSLNSAISINRSRDKLRSLQLLSRKGIGLPITGFAYTLEDIRDLIAMVGGTPILIKLLQGTQGVGVVLAETNKAAGSTLEAFFGLGTPILVQEYIKEAKGADIRCFVIGKRVVASMQRQAKAGEFRANIHRGATAKSIKITAKERKVAIKAAQLMGLNVAGVDLLRSKRGPMVLEVNSSPGLEGIEKVTQKNIAEQIIRFMERVVGKSKLKKGRKFEG